MKLSSRIAVGVLAALCAAVPAQAKPRLDCLRSGTTVSADARARLFYAGVAGDYRLYVCWVPARRVRTLGALDLGETGPAVPVLAGEWVAYDRLACADPEACSGRAVVRSARTGRRLRMAPAQPGRASGIVLTRSGTAAWIRDKVYALGPGGLRILDAAGPPVVDPASLALAGTRVFWLHGGAPATADVAQGGPAHRRPSRASQSKPLIQPSWLSGQDERGPAGVALFGGSARVAGRLGRGITSEPGSARKVSRPEAGASGHKSCPLKPFMRELARKRSIRPLV